ncbi:hypothetical protein R1sor_018550 [Riccia sorocarpa]|uniref:Uncharacterized protein n=1 Tax=Riccia sorocarpa TaxID=122646 RepID=A0ABD3IA10_9MARC
MDVKTEDVIVTTSPLRTPIQRVRSDRPLADIIHDLSKRIPDHLLSKVPQKWFEAQKEAREREFKECRKRHYPLDLFPYDVPRKYIPWYNAVRVLNHYAPGWVGEVRNIAVPGQNPNTFVTVVYRITLKGSDGEVCREASATSTMDYSDHSVYFSPVQNAEREAFCKTCLLFGLGLYLYHSPDAPASDYSSDEYLQVPP